MTIYYISETNEFTKDVEVYNGAIEAGLSAAELEEDDLVRWLQQAWKEKDDMRQMCVGIAREIKTYAEDGHNSTMKQAYFSFIHNKAQEILSIQ